MAIANSASSPAPWHAAYPAPRNSQPEAIRREDVLEIMKLGQNKAGKDYVLVDLRRNDHEVNFYAHIHDHASNEAHNTVGWDYPRLDQSSRAELIPYHTYFVRYF